jgi:hypothetical protein
MKRLVSLIHLFPVVVFAGCQCSGRTVSVSTSLSSSPASLDFGDVAVGTSKTLTVTLSNTSRADVQVTTADIAAGGSAGFSVAVEGLNLDISAGGTLAVPVTFAPQTTGAASATAVIDSDATMNGSVSVPLAGNGTPGIQLVVRPEGNPDAGITVKLGAPLGLDFGETFVDTQKVAQIEVTDIGTEGITLAPIEFADGGSPDFAVSQPASSMITPNGGTISFTVSFTPTKAEDAQSTVLISSADGTVSAIPVTVSGQCQPRIQVCASSGVCAATAPWPTLAFGTVQAASEEIQQISIENVGWAPLDYTAQLAPGTSVEFSLGSASAAGGGVISGTLPPPSPWVDGGAAVPMSVILIPDQSATAVATYGGSVNVTSNDPTLDGGAAMVYLTGMCSNCTIPPPVQDGGCGVLVGSQGCTSETDSFADAGLNGWSFAGQGTPSAGCSAVCNGGSCDCSLMNQGYQLGIDADAGAAEVFGDVCSQNTRAYGVASGGMQKTFSINPGHMRIEFNWRATSCWDQSSTTTNAQVSLVDPSTGTVLWTDALAEGGTYDTGWQHYQGDVSCFVQGLSQVVVVLYLHDAWDADWQQADYFNQIRVTTCTQ